MVTVESEKNESFFQEGSELSTKSEKIDGTLVLLQIYINWY
jgi:hypothetical protein